MVPSDGGKGRRAAPSSLSPLCCSGSCGRWRGKQEVYLLPFIKPPAAERLPATGGDSTALSSTATAVPSEQKAPHPR